MAVAGRSSTRALFERRRNGWEANNEFAAAPRSLTGGLNFAAVQRYQTAHQRQPDSQASLRMVERAIPLSKEIEDLRQLFGGNAGPRITNVNCDLLAFDLRPQMNLPSRRRVFRRIVE